MFWLPHHMSAAWRSPGGPALGSRDEGHGPEERAVAALEHTVQRGRGEGSVAWMDTGTPSGLTVLVAGELTNQAGAGLEGP